METCVARVAAWLTALFLLAASCSGCETGEPDRAASPAVQQVPLKVIEREDQALAFVPVTIAGHGPLLFALDTGASSSVIDETIAKELGLTPTGETHTIRGVVGIGQASLVEVPRWKIGNVDLPSARLAAIDLDIPEGGQDLQGLLGSDVLSDFGRVVIDYDRQQLEIPTP